jgi:hypothetical protein
MSRAYFKCLDLTCDHCMRNEQLLATSRTACKRMAAHMGWDRHGSEDTCPRCVELLAAPDAGRAEP